jgi:hypothetical protein
MDSKADVATIEQAYLLDVAEFSGSKAFPVTDSKIVKQVAVALYNHTRRTKKQKRCSLMRQSHFIGRSWFISTTKTLPTRLKS